MRSQAPTPSAQNQSPWSTPPQCSSRHPRLTLSPPSHWPYQPQPSPATHRASLHFLVHPVVRTTHPTPVAPKAVHHMLPQHSPVTHTQMLPVPTQPSRVHHALVQPSPVALSPLLHVPVQHTPVTHRPMLHVLAQPATPVPTNQLLPMPVQHTPVPPSAVHHALAQPSPTYTLHVATATAAAASPP
jgi:hypothetical protein